MVFIKYKNLSKPEKWLILGIPALFIIGSVMHFVYDLTGQLALVGAFAPVNESIWEHLKLILLPMIGWWYIYYAVNCKKHHINKEKWFFANVISIIVSMKIVVAFYYTYTYAFGIHSLALDIFDLLLGLIAGQFLGLHIFKYSKGVKIQVSVCILILLVAAFVIFTFNPPHLPLFKDSLSGQYGI